MSLNERQSYQKFVALAFLLASALFGFFVQQFFAALWVVFRITSPAWILSPADIIGLGVAVLTFVLLITNKNASKFTLEAILELEKVIWPNRKETMTSTVVVSILVGISSLILFSFDFIWGSMIGLLYR
ncbi:MAG: preprotein translocase subunit SecE [Deltaproteobacteria bacterium CG_4_10_14_0_2_um_filter_43_8]|nr:MAG: preprotein translocase subunit SecE [Deltaproteobacteria bacterium CG11_big_fil_rev_8_21_14_0_20_42_23]PJA20729.1 MAG: preprotein translocase subunit SecE [Deltaproteobacteria bacterium CG_4_10_14_0_2_um_filter_43_8]PJC63959.1 MAG: preprotein translocase subunit SecE [Deltaproteobacteria bacterium CG_4_9_14_0_2_um_filter_42_21]